MLILNRKSCFSFFFRGCCATVVAIFLGCTLIACNEGVEQPPASSSTSSSDDCLPDIVLTDVHGHSVNLASLKGKPVLFDFFYTTCPGPCLMLTARMRQIAAGLGSTLGTKAWLVSITVDPEHDQPRQLLDYTKEQGAADRPGWLFLTGTPQQIDEVMARFNLRRQRESDGSVDHVLEFFLVGPDGHQILQYLATDTNPAKIAEDVERAAAGERVVDSSGVQWRG
jgi:protein SCO1